MTLRIAPRLVRFLFRSRSASRVARGGTRARIQYGCGRLTTVPFHATRFLVLELVEGDTLADRLKHGAIPVEESLKLALQVAEALEAAHEKGVIHRIAYDRLCLQSGCE